MAGDRATIDFFARWMRRTGDPATAAAYNRTWDAIDLHPVLSSIRVPVLLTSRGAGPGEAEYVASLIPGARAELFGGDDFMPFYAPEPILEAIESFIRAPGS